ncbi:MAG: hypothetical protein H7Y11_02885 [Armatimonadetes bacterium]|nr:hypothetical protein [Anaerolineae bacterium]
MAIIRQFFISWIMRRFAAPVAIGCGCIIMVIGFVMLAVAGLSLLN